MNAELQRGAILNLDCFGDKSSHGGRVDPQHNVARHETLGPLILMANQ